MLKTLLLGIYNLAPSLFHALRYLSPRYYRGVATERAYAAHHREAQRVYQVESGKHYKPVRDISTLGVEVATPGASDNPFSLPADYLGLVDRVRDDVVAKFSLARNCYFFPRANTTPLPELTADVPEIRAGDVITLQLRNPLEVDGLNELCAPLIEQLEEKYYGSYLLVDKVYIYRNPVSRQREQASWLWHYDNHPSVVNKMMVCLTDVSEETGPFEFLYSPATAAPYKFRPIPNLSKPFLETRIFARQIERHKRNGYVSRKLTGPRGTTAFFSENIAHKANIAKTGRRDVVVFQVRPSLSRSTRYIDPRWTGSFQNLDIIPDPRILAPAPKPVMASG